MSKASSHKQAIQILKHLPQYGLIFGWNRSALAKLLLKWFVAPDPEDDSKRAQAKRDFVTSFRLDELAKDYTPYYNRQPFTNMLQMIVCFDRLVEFSIELGINPFKDLPVNGLTIGVWGNWIGGLQWPGPFIQEDINNFFVKKLSPRHNVFQLFSDSQLIRLGYLTDKHLPLEEKSNWKGDRFHVGGDKNLRLTALSASFPLFAYTQKTVKYGPWDEINYQIKLKKHKGSKSTLETTQWYVRKSYYFGKKRYERLLLVKQMLGHIELIGGSKENIAIETWL